MLVVAALGGNALLRHGEPLDASSQARNVAMAAAALTGIAQEHDLVITHGNGPQVGLLAMQSASLPDDAAGFPLDVLGAETEGMIGYLLARELRGRLPGRDVASLLTQVVVDPEDPAFRAPVKPIGPIYDSLRARQLSDAHGWTFAEASTGGFTRVVASPEPIEIIELAVIQLLVSARVIVTCAGGGGIPVSRDTHGALRGVEAVIDKDLASARLAEALSADFLMLLTDQPGVFPSWPDRSSGILSSTTVEALGERAFEAGTMAPKVDAARRFVAATGTRAAIGELADAENILAGCAGTHVVPS